jgi:hypothetical protein
MPWSLSGSLKWIDSAIAWITIEIDSAVASARESGSSLEKGCGQGPQAAGAPLSTIVP